MSHYTTTLVWQRDAQAFVDHRYSRRHMLHFDGGVALLGSSSPQIVPEPMSDPAGVDPEEAFVASLSSCHMLWFLDYAAKAGWVVDHYRDQAEGVMARVAPGKLAMTVVTLRPAVRFAQGRGPSPDALHALHHQAHESCFIANSVKTEVRCEPLIEADGSPQSPLNTEAQA